MGFSPQQVDAMSIWQWQSAVNGYIEANTPREGAKLSDAEADELFDWIEASGATGVLTTQTYQFDDAGRLMPAGVVTFSM